MDYTNSPTGLPDEVIYGSICPCNPSNGGSGICGCIMGNQMVPNPKKFGPLDSTTTYFTTTGKIDGEDITPNKDK